MIPPKFIDVLREIHSRLNDGAVTWVVAGSLNLALQGVPVEVHDIDIAADAAGAYEIARRFARFVMRPVVFSSADSIRSHFGALAIDGVEVEIIGDFQHRRADGTWDAPVDLALHRRFVEVERMRVPVLSLEYARWSYLLMGRSMTADLVAARLAGGQDASAGATTNEGEQ